MKFALFFAPAILLSQTHAGKVAGGVVNSVTNDPVGKATVILRAGPGGVHHTTQAGADGRFVIEDVEPGPYDVTASRQGFTVDRPRGIRVSDGDSVRDLIVRLIPQGVIAGRMLDADGDPLRGSVGAMQFTYVNGKRQLAERARVTPNIDGEFRLFGLRPGTYYLQAVPRASTVPRPLNEPLRGSLPPGFVPTFFPATIDVSRAVPIDVAAGALVRGMDIKVQRSALYSIRAKLPPTTGPAERGVSLRHAESTRSIEPGFTYTYSSDYRSVEINDVRPGQYVIVANQGDERKRTFAHQLVTVDNADVDAGMLNFTPAIEVSGAVLVEGKLPTPLQNLRITLEPEGPAGFSTPNSPLGADGVFTLRDVAPDVYRLRVTQVQGAYPKSIRFGDKELPDNRLDLTREVAPLTITMATDVGRIEGIVRTADGNPAVRVVVSAVPLRTARADLYRWTMTNDQGKFGLGGIAPIEYKVFAWEDVDQGAPQSAEFRKPFEDKGTPVKLDPGGRVSLELRAIR